MALDSLEWERAGGTSFLPHARDLHLRGLPAQLDSDVRARVSHSDHQDVLPLKSLGVLVLAAVKIPAFEPLYTFRRKKREACQLHQLTSTKLHCRFFLPGGNHLFSPLPLLGELQ